jgi:hypothetical protein
MEADTARIGCFWPRTSCPSSTAFHAARNQRSALSLGMAARPCEGRGKCEALWCAVDHLRSAPYVCVNAPFGTARAARGTYQALTPRNSRPKTLRLSVTVVNKAILRGKSRVARLELMNSSNALSSPWMGRRPIGTHPPGNGTLVPPSRPQGNPRQTEAVVLRVAGRDEGCAGRMLER